MIAPTLTDFLLFGAKDCPHCGRQLPRCTDFFAPDAHMGGGLASYCRQCRNERSNAAYHADPTRKREAMRRYQARKAALL